MVKYVRAGINCKYTDGYRNEEVYGSRVNNLYDIVDWEINELENLDIPDYLQKHYGFNAFEIDFDRYDYIEDGSLAEATIDFLKQRFPEYKYGLWLASKEAVVDYYEGDENNMNRYIIPDDAVIVSDLGREGYLVATKERLYPQEDN